MDTYIKRYSMELVSATQNVGLFTLLQLIGGIVQKQSGGTLVGIPQMALQTKITSILLQQHMSFGQTTLQASCFCLYQASHLPLLW